MRVQIRMYGNVGSRIAIAAPKAVNIHRRMSDNNWFGCITVIFMCGTKILNMFIL